MRTHTNISKFSVAVFSSGLLLLSATGALAQNGNGNNGSNGASNGQPFQTLQDAIDAEEAARIAADAAEAAVRAAEDARLQSEIDDLQQDLADHIAEYDTAIGDIQGDIAQIQADVSTMENDLDLLSTDVDANADAIAELEADIGDLQAEMATKQDILDGACRRGYSLRVIYPDGGFLCERDDVSRGVSQMYATSRYSSLSTTRYWYRNRNQASIAVYCPRGWEVSGGGHEAYRTHRLSELDMLRSSPFNDVRRRVEGWQITASNPSSRYSIRVRGVVNCVR